MNNKMKKIAAAVAMIVSLGGVAGIGAVNAQGPIGQAGGPGAGLGLALVCSTTNYTDVAAKALGLQSPALRQALVSGKTLEQIATSKQVTIQTVTDALKAAHLADLDQALKDGLLTQTQYDQIKSRMDQSPSSAPAAGTPAATPDATQQANPQNPGPNGRPGFGNRPGGRAGLFLRVPDHNQVNSFQVASTAIGISCADLVKAMTGGQTIAQVATSKNIQVQTVIDALVTAEKAAITQDVTEGLIAQVQADSEIANAVNRAGSLVYSAGRLGRPGMGFGFGPGGPRGNGNDNGNGQPPAPGLDGNNSNVQPPSDQPAAPALPGQSNQ